jgi:ketosteroid isomerase-like protein
MILALLFAVLLQMPAVAQDKTTERLRAKDQALLDAVAPGDRKPWEQALAPDAVYVDEEGNIMDWAAFLKQLGPLVAGISGNIKITSYVAHVSGDLAIVVHTDDEQENYHGQMLTARYITTETWHRDAGEWTLHLTHVYAAIKDPPAISLSSQELQQYVGRYVGGPDLVYLIRWDGKQLVGGRQGRELKPLQVEVRDVLFVPGQPRTRKIFQRDANGKVIGLIDRRGGEDLVFRLDTPAHS